MSKPILTTLLLASAIHANAANWEIEFFSPIQNEMPPTNGVAVDELGYTHIQAFNRQIAETNYYLAHTYTVNAQGQTPWIWGLQAVNQMSDCGVFARAGQRLDCFEENGFQGQETKLVMRSKTGSAVIWSTVLAGELSLLDASITAENEAILVAQRNVFGAPEQAVVATVSGNGVISYLNSSPACNGGSAWIESKFSMPKDPSSQIQQLTTCRNAFGSALAVSEFDLATQTWSVSQTWFVNADTAITHSAINSDGRAFVVTKHISGEENLLATNEFGQWQLFPLPGIGHVVHLVVNGQTLVLASDGQSEKRSSPNTITWFNLSGPFFPMTRLVPELALRDFRGVALSSQGQLIVANIPRFYRERHESITVVSPFGGVDQYSLPYDRTETILGKSSYVFGGPNNTAIVVRNIQKWHGGIGVRANQFQLIP